jgi:gliding motility-associated-like protein
VLDASGIVVGSSSTTSSLTDGSYDYLITDDHGCSATLNFYITQPAKIIIIDNTTACSILLEVQDAVGNYNIFWTGPNGFSANSDTISNLSEGMYFANVRDANNCWSSDSFYVTPINIDYSTQNASCVTEADGMISVNNFIGGAAPYSVYNNGNLHTQNEYVSTTIDALFAGTHSLLITDANNCELDTLITLDFDGGYDCIVVPIIISPNYDGINDTWKPILDLPTDIEVSILNRWGKLVYYYSGNSIGFEWDGLSTDNDKLPSMDYYYIIKFNNVNYPDRTGVITLIR